MANNAPRNTTISQYIHMGKSKLTRVTANTARVTATSKLTGKLGQKGSEKNVCTISFKKKI